jgi:hypothetical protein
MCRNKDAWCHTPCYFMFRRFGNVQVSCKAICPCFVNFMVSGFGSHWNALHTGGEAYASSDVLIAIKAAHLPAIATALAQVKKTGTTCSGEVAASAIVCPNCQKLRSMRCAGIEQASGKFSVWGCCSADLECRMLKDSRIGRCKPRGWVPPAAIVSLWSADVVTCSA